MRTSENKKSNIKYFSLTAPLLGRIPGLFLPIASGKRPKDFKLDIKLGKARLYVELPEGLDSTDQSVLLALIALAGIDSKIIHSDKKGPKSTLLWDKLKVSFSANNEKCVLVTTTQAEILKVLDWNRSGNEYEKLKKCLARLSNVNFHMVKGEYQWRSGLLSYLFDKNGEKDEVGVVHVVLNSVLSKAVNGEQFIKICLEERKSLSSNVAKLLHSWLSCNINAGHRLSPYLDTLVQRIWNTPSEKSQSKMKTPYDKKEQRRKRSKIDEALKEIGELEGWRIELSDAIGVRRQVTVRRL